MLIRSKLMFIVAGALTLSACASPVIGPSVTLQEDAIFACAKNVGDQVFPISIKSGIRFEPGGQVHTARVEPSVNMTAAQADAINACAAASVGSQIEAVSVSEPSPPTEPQAVRSQFEAPVSTCPAGSAVMRGGSQYCVGLK